MLNLSSNVTKHDGHFSCHIRHSQSSFQSEEAVPLNNEAFLSMMSNAGSGGLTVEINVQTRYELI